jgi:CelD/BcsL family acetyltransferase involved in cellulose biosynthesis
MQSTHTLDLGLGVEAVRAAYHDSHKRSLRKAQKAGLVVVLATDENDFDAYYGLYLETLRRWSDSTLIRFPRSLFDEIQRRQSRALRLWAAMLDGRMIAGMLVFYHRRTACYWHGASGQEAMSCGAGPFLMDEVVRSACEEGVVWFDLGPSGGLRGVEEFKERFGAVRHEFGSFVWNSNSLYRVYGQALRLRRLAARAIGWGARATNQ